MSGPQELRTAIALYNVEEYEACVNFINRVYLDTTPLYRRLRYNVLLACCLDDWNESEHHRYYAENHYDHWCLFNPAGSYARVEEDRADLRRELDELSEYLASFRPDDWKETQRFWTASESADAEEEYEAMIAKAEGKKKGDVEDEDQDEEDEEDEDEDEEEEEEVVDDAEAEEEEQQSMPMRPKR